MVSFSPPFPVAAPGFGVSLPPSGGSTKQENHPHFFCSRFHSHLIIKTPPPLPKHSTESPSTRPRRDVGLLHFGPVPAPHLQPPVQRRRPSSGAPGGGALIATPSFRLFIATPSFRLFLSRLSESVRRSLCNPRRLWSEILDRSSSSRLESPPMPHPASTRTSPTSASTTSPSSLPPSPSPSLGLLPACRAPLFCLSLLISNLLLPPISPDRSMSAVKLLRWLSSCVASLDRGLGRKKRKTSQALIFLGREVSPVNPRRRYA